MKSLTIKAFITVVAFSTMAQADTVKNFVLSNSKSTGITFQIGYSAGVHDGTTSAMNALVTLSEKNEILKGEFSIPIENVSTGNATRDCHMREALGIDYAHSQFPTDHVCDSDNKVPASGPDSIAFPTISFKFVNVKKNSGSILPEVLEVGKVYDVAVQGQWTMHGKTVDFSGDTSTEFIPVQIKLLNADTQELQVSGKFQISLKDFNIVVKPFKIAFLSIGVADNAKVTLNTKMILQK